MFGAMHGCPRRRRNKIYVGLISTIICIAVFANLFVQQDQRWTVRFKPKRLPLQSLHPISAFKDPRTPTDIVIIAVVNKALTRRTIYCHFFDQETHTLSVNATSHPQPLVDYEMNFVGHLFLCPINSSSVMKKITSAAISFERTESSDDQRTTVINIPPRPPRKSSIVACVAPLFGNRYNAAHIVAWIEMNRLLGVNHFVFYNYSIHTQLDPMYKYYMNSGVVTMRQWHLTSIPTATAAVFPPLKDKVHYYGQLEAMNDCLYRFTNRYRYIMFIDLDELIIPFSHRRLDHFLDFELKRKTKIGEFIFWMTYLPSSLPKEPTTHNLSLVRNEHVVFFERTSLENRVIYTMKQKAIVVGHALKRMSVHRRVEFWGKAVTFFVNAKTARLLHYTDPPVSLIKKGLRGRRDPRLLKYLSPLINVTESVLSNLSRINV